MTKILETVAAYAYEYGNDQGSEHLRSALLAAVLADRYGLDASRAVDVARGYEDHPYVREAGNERDRLLKQAERAFLAREMGGAA